MGEHTFLYKSADLGPRSVKYELRGGGGSERTSDLHKINQNGRSMLEGCCDLRCALLAGWGNCRC